MKGEGSNSYLKYEIYADADRTFVWSWDRFRMSSVASVTGTGAADPKEVYGSVVEGQGSAITGNYLDTIVATISY